MSTEQVVSCNRLPARSERLKGAVALVFGAGAVGPGWGNGRATAFALARAGARVICADLVSEAAEETARLIKADRGTAWPLSADVTDSASVAAAVKAAAERAGPVGILINNVGSNVAGGLMEVSEDEWRAQFAVNLDGAFHACRAVVPGMIAKGGGAIVNVSSMASLRVGAYAYIGYAVAKAGLNHLTRAIAVEYAASGVRANAVLPGRIDTPHVAVHMAAHAGGADPAARVKGVPMKRLGSPFDVANAAVFLASEEARFITGVCLPVDGGAHVAAH
ncbi:MAG: SDR family NAD(P)-dependent oxidoreductase [Pseudomonadota bacterium]